MSAATLPLRTVKGTITVFVKVIKVDDPSVDKKAVLCFGPLSGIFCFHLLVLL